MRGAEGQPVIPPETPISEIGERGLLRRIRARIPQSPGVVVGAGDDAAALETGPLTLLTTDCLVEGVHFRRDWSPARLLGRKALTVNLSDIAAMAGLPRHATVSLCLPGDLTVGFVDELYGGLLERGAEAGVGLVGGNLSATSGPVVVDVALVGQADRMLLRSGAHPGDLAVVTGTLGAAAAGLKLLAQGARLGSDGQLESTGLWSSASATAVGHCLRVQLDPAPPLAFARAIAEQGLAHAGMDLSDGLSGDLLELCVESGVSAQLDPSAVPLDPHAAGLERAQGRDPLALGLHGGEDYQQLLAVSKDDIEAVRDIASLWELPVAVVGEFAPGPPALWLRSGERLLPLVPLSHEHFVARAGARSFPLVS
jgi:thiamine-monophosphate kinase